MGNIKDWYSDGEVIGYDFQGWPVLKRTWRFILNSIGISFDSENKADVSNPNILDTCPKVYEGVEYSPITKWITRIDSNNIWIDESEEDIKKRRENSKLSTYTKVTEDLYTAFGWPEVQQYMEKDWWKEVAFDSGMNLWFVPTKYIN